MRLTHNEDYEVSSGNIFRDLGLADADELDLKTDLALIIARRIRKLGLSQMKAAQIMGLDQPKVSALIRGHLEKFSRDRLCELVSRLGYNVDIRLRATRDGAPGRLKIKASRT
jgi:predicted XRE-type DNA-binding protein